MARKIWCIADCHGLLGFDIGIEGTALAKVRADNNRHKHCVLFRIQLPMKDQREVQRLVNDGESAEALLYIRRNITVVGFPPGSEHYRASFAKIPNPSLDPFGIQD